MLEVVIELPAKKSHLAPLLKATISHYKRTPRVLSVTVGVLEWVGMDQVMAMGLGLVGVETVPWITAVALDGVLEMATAGVLEWAGMDQVMAMGLGLVGVEMALWITALALDGVLEMATVGVLEWVGLL